jgi:polyferredoxin
MASEWYGMEIANMLNVWLLLWLIATAFFLLQSALLNWMGLPAMGILVLLFFFSMPVLNMPPEFLPQVTQD